jgi:hypothetical protein
MDSIYTLTSVLVKPSEPSQHSVRCWAWYASIDEAKNTVESCGEFFYEYYYNYLVIEEVPRATIAKAYKEWWYKWSEELNKWEVADKPEPNICHYGIG